MRRFLILILLVSFISEILANKDSASFNTKQLMSKLSVRVDMNFMKVTGSSGFKTSSINGIVQVDYKINKKFFAGVYIGSISDLSSKDRYFKIENKVYNLTTSKMIFYGLSGSYNLWSEGRFSIYPELRVGLGHLEVDEINQSQNSNFVLKRSMFMIVPRANFSYRIGKVVESGITFSYLFTRSFNNDINQYDLGNINGGIFCKFHF